MSPAAARIIADSRDVTAGWRSSYTSGSPTGGCADAPLDRPEP